MFFGGVGFAVRVVGCLLGAEAALYHQAPMHAPIPTQPQPERPLTAPNVWRRGRAQQVEAAHEAIGGQEAPPAGRGSTPIGRCCWQGFRVCLLLLRVA